MGFARWQIACVVAVTSALAPLGIVAWLLVTPALSQAELATLVLAAAVWMAALFKANWWEFTSVHLRWVWAVLVAAAIALRLAEWASWPSWRGVTWQLAVGAAIALAGAATLALAVGGSRHDRSAALELAFPLAGGRFLVTDGGDGKRAPATNYHYGFVTHRAGGVSASMRFATDIVEIGPLGGEAASFLPRRNDAYRIWEHPVLAPVGGEIVRVADDVADNDGFGAPGPYGVGNQVVIRAEGDVYVVIGHLRHGSVIVAESQHVEPGARIGLVGNSGWTERPHVHMQAMRAPDGDWWHGAPVPMTFGGRLLVRNDSVRA